MSGNLPAELTTFVGRRAEVAAVRQALSSSRLVTLVGPGGVGKTRLALRAAAASQRAFDDGAWFVDISPLRDEDLLAATIVSALGLQSRSPRWAPAELSRQLASKSMLLILDNCEYLSYACAVMADTLLKNCPQLHLLATSRQPLEVGGERLLDVRPLALPTSAAGRRSPAVLEQVDAIALFVDRAQAAEPRFQLTEENAPAVADLCERLDGLPLAIELAAARVRHFSPQQIIDRLEPRYGLLESGSKVTAPRQRSLRTLIGWSYDLCSPTERLLWSRLTVFSGSFGAEATEAVCSDQDLPEESVLPTLAALVDKSIVATERGDSDVRYRMLATIRAFGQEKLVAAGEETAFRRRHRDHFRDIAASLYARWFGADQVAMMTWLRVERDNLRAALDFAITQGEDVERTATIAIPLASGAIVSGVLGEGRHWVDRTLAALDEWSLARAVVLWTGSWCTMQQGDLDTAESMLASAKRIVARTDNPHDKAMVTASQGLLRMLRGQLQDALDLFAEALEISRAEDDVMCMAVATLRQGLCLYRLGERARGIALCRESIKLSDTVGERWHKAEALRDLSAILWQEDEVDESAELAQEALRILRRFRYAVGTAHCFETLAWAAARHREFERAARLSGAADSLWQATDVQLPPHLTAFKDRCAAETRSVLGARAFESAYRRGSESTVEGNTAFALHERRSEQPARPEAEPVHLTKREREIADLVATGASNKDIAASLFISRRTAESHVVNILAKLGFTSRAQIAAWVAAQRTSASH